MNSWKNRGKLLFMHELYLQITATNLYKCTELDSIGEQEVSEFELFVTKK